MPEALKTRRKSVPPTDPIRASGLRFNLDMIEAAVQPRPAVRGTRTMLHSKQQLVIETYASDPPEAVLFTLPPELHARKFVREFRRTILKNRPDLRLNSMILPGQVWLWTVVYTGAPPGKRRGRPRKDTVVVVKDGKGQEVRLGRASGQANGQMDGRQQQDGEPLRSGR